MRRIAGRTGLSFLSLLIVAALFVSPEPAPAQSRKPSVMVKVTSVSRVSELARKFGFRVKKAVTRGTTAMFVVEDLSVNQVTELLKNELGFVWAEENRALPLDGGETVLPLGGGPSVAPLDGGETVLPLDDETDEMITALLDGGETVLPLDELTTIRDAYTALSSRLTPSQSFLLQPAFRKIGLYPAVLKATGRGVVVADLDTGADTCHSILSGIVTYSFVEGSQANAPEDCANSGTPQVPGFGHGTAVASMIRVTAPEATVWAMRVFDNSGSAQISDIYEAVIFAADRGVDVINMSFGTSQPSLALAEAMAYARERGVVLVAAGGNSNLEPLMYPAAIPGVNGIVAVNSDDVKAAFSNYGTMAAVSAPGYGLWVAYPNQKLAYVAGTSFAAPLVAGEAALILETLRRTSNSDPNSVGPYIHYGSQPIDDLNPGYAGKLGRGRMHMPTALELIPSSQ